ncbi:MAG: F0F1 ATP synthase subunit B [Candidatus Omnitrophica bacterium]|nr:F0F1 ATP synthase subunit B [Candidatus Omnitrophota bacterium]
MELLKLLNFNEIIVQVISFLILLFVLRIFAWGRILSILQSRRERIANEFNAIDEAKADAARLKREYETHLGEIEQKARGLINKAVEDGHRITYETRKIAYVQAQDIISDARKNIAYELKRAQDEVRDKIVDLAIAAAETVIREKFTEKEDQRIVEEFIKNIDKAE